MNRIKKTIALLIAAIMISGVAIAAPTQVEATNVTTAATNQESNQKEAQPKGRFEVITDAINIRDRAETSETRLGIVKKGDILSFYEKSGNWYKIKYKDDYAWVCAGTGSKKYVQEISGYLEVVATALNVRRAAKAAGTPLGILKKGTVVECRGKKGNWYKISYKGREGWICRSAKGSVYVKERSDPAVAIDEPTQEANYVYISSIPANIREKPNTKCKVVYKIVASTSDKAKYIPLNSAKLTNGFYSIKFQGKDCWVHKSNCKLVVSNPYDVTPVTDPTTTTTAATSTTTVTPTESTVSTTVSTTESTVSTTASTDSTTNTTTTTLAPPISDEPEEPEPPFVGPEPPIDDSMTTTSTTSTTKSYINEKFIGYLRIHANSYLKQYKEPRMGVGIYAEIAGSEEVGYYDTYKDGDDVWYCILYNGRVGWVKGIDGSEKYVDELPATYQTTTATQPAKKETGVIKVVSEKSISIYEKKDTGSYAFNTSIPNGAELQYLDKETVGSVTWYCVVYKGYIGYVIGKDGDTVNCQEVAQAE